MEVFVNQTGHPSGFGEGRYLASTTVRTDASGRATIDSSTSLSSSPPGSIYSATATDLTIGETSEFSPWIVGGLPPVTSEQIAQHLLGLNPDTTNLNVNGFAPVDSADLVSAVLLGW